MMEMSVVFNQLICLTVQEYFITINHHENEP